MRSSFDLIIKSTFRSAGAPRRREIGNVAANKVIGRLNTYFPLGQRGAQLIDELAKRNINEGQSFLEQNLANQIIGYDFNRLECHILDLLSAEEAVSMFIQFGQHSNRARNMWHTYYKYNDVKAVKLLDVLANKDWERLANKEKDIRLLKTAYLGHLSGRLRMQKMGTSMASNVLNISKENKLKLPVSLLTLRSPLIMHAVKGLNTETICDFFIKRFIRDEEFNVYEISAVKFMLKSLGNKKAFDLYASLVKKKIIKASEDMEKQYPNEGALINATDGHISDKIICLVQDSIEAARLRRIELKAQQSVLWNLLFWRKNK